MKSSRVERCSTKTSRKAAAARLWKGNGKVDSRWKRVVGESQAIDKKELEKDSSKVIWTVLQGNSTKDLPNHDIAITPASVGTL